jgi:hypothetical protein
VLLLDVGRGISVGIVASSFHLDAAAIKRAILTADAGNDGTAVLSLDRLNALISVCPRPRAAPVSAWLQPLESSLRTSAGTLQYR